MNSGFFHQLLCRLAALTAVAGGLQPCRISGADVSPARASGFQDVQGDISVAARQTVAVPLDLSQVGSLTGVNRDFLVWVGFSIDDDPAGNNQVDSLQGWTRARDGFGNGIAGFAFADTATDGAEVGSDVEFYRASIWSVAGSSGVPPFRGVVVSSENGRIIQSGAADLYRLPNKDDADFVQPLYAPHYHPDAVLQKTNGKHGGFAVFRLRSRETTEAGKSKLWLDPLMLLTQRGQYRNTYIGGREVSSGLQVKLLLRGPLTVNTVGVAAWDAKVEAMPISSTPHDLTLTDQERIAFNLGNPDYDDDGYPTVGQQQWAGVAFSEADNDSEKNDNNWLVDHKYDSKAKYLRSLRFGRTPLIPSASAQPWSARGAHLALPIDHVDGAPTAAASKPPGWWNDANHDFIPDGWTTDMAIAYGLAPNHQLLAASADPERDGVTNLHAFLRCVPLLLLPSTTDAAMWRNFFASRGPNGVLDANGDQDGDGRSNGEEIDAFVDALKKTTYGLPGSGVTIYHSLIEINDPFVADRDRDGDGLETLWEMANGLDPGNADDAGWDLDYDGLSNQWEAANGTDLWSPPLFELQQVVTGTSQMEEQIHWDGPFSVGSSGEVIARLSSAWSEPIEYAVLSRNGTTRRIRMPRTIAQVTGNVFETKGYLAVIGFDASTWRPVLMVAVPGATEWARRSIYAGQATVSWWAAIDGADGDSFFVRSVDAVTNDNLIISVNASTGTCTLLERSQTLLSAHSGDQMLPGDASLFAFFANSVSGRRIGTSPGQAPMSSIIAWPDKSNGSTYTPAISFGGRGAAGGWAFMGHRSASGGAQEFMTSLLRVIPRGFTTSDSQWMPYHGQYVAAATPSGCLSLTSLNDPAHVMFSSGNESLEYTSVSVPEGYWFPTVAAGSDIRVVTGEIASEEFFGTVTKEDLGQSVPALWRNAAVSGMAEKWVAYQLSRRIAGYRPEALNLQMDRVIGDGEGGYYVLGVATAAGERLYRLKRVADTDGDGVSDAWEDRMGTDPFRFDQSHGTADADSDGLSLLDELAAGTDPLSADTDQDGMPDGWEVAEGLDPVDQGDSQLDPDGDRVTNRQEYAAGTKPLGRLNPDLDPMWDGPVGAKVRLGGGTGGILRDDGSIAGSMEFADPSLPGAVWSYLPSSSPGQRLLSVPNNVDNSGEALHRQVLGVGPNGAILASEPGVDPMARLELLSREAPPFTIETSGT